MTDEMADDLNKLFEGRLRIIHSQGSSANAAGVAFAINRDITNADQAIAEEVIPGRAISLTIPWHDNHTLTLLNVYAPNAPSDNSKFWGKLTTHYSAQRHRDHPEIMLGDLNLVEDSIDRIPAHPDNTAATTELQTLRDKIKVIDGWRHTHPDEKDFSFQADATGSQSRIDRIYVSRAVYETAFDWGISDTAIRTDHRLTTVRIAKPNTPESGPGRWAMPAIVIQDKRFLDAAVARGIKLEREIDSLELRSETINAQTLFKQFKVNMKNLGRTAAKRLIPKIKLQIESLQKDRREALNGLDVSMEDAKHTAGLIGERIREIEHSRHEKARMTVKIRDRLEGETIGPYLTSLNSPRQPREILHRLRIPHSNPPSYTTSTHHMTQIAKEHHDTLQDEDKPWAPERRDLTIENMCDTIDESNKLTAADADSLGSRITRLDVITSLKASASAKAPGLDGLPYEIWETLHILYEQPRKNGRRGRAFDIMKVLTSVFNDIEDHGVVDSADFAEGWMCPIYKKKERTEIANYRPITLLNTDYKIFTKILASRLAKLAHKMINPAQAGFIPNRSIADQVRLAKLMTDYAEATEENGMIVCLDQEKAYDKIKHDYLWKALSTYGLPAHFVDIVKSLYRFARTRVMVNGELSENFLVTRGVRQGDPLSCLLFNLAIEPLANTLRLSPKLQGFLIPGSTEKLIATLFADDTTVYLSEFDDFRDLKVELDRWCLASGARFNVTKTEAIPLGTPEYRQRLRDTRRNKAGGTRLQADIHITLEGEPTRSLGGWIGNKVEQAQVWSKTLDKVQCSLDRWAKGRPTLHLKSKIVQITAGAITQYLATVQGMPRIVEDRIEKMVKIFVWEGARAPLRMDYLYEPLDNGGLGMLDIRSRNDAIELRWCRTYLNLGGARPTWALVADVLLEGQIPKSQGTIDRDVTINQFLQTWRPNTSGNSKLPRELTSLIKVSRKYNVELAALRLTDKAKKSLPAWYHIGSDTHPGRIHTRNTSTCLKRQHRTMRVKDMVAVTKRLRHDTPDHKHHKISTCACKYCKRDRRRGCTSPWRCCETAREMLTKLQPKFDPFCNPEADNLSLTPARIEANAAARGEGEYVLFNPSIVKGDDLSPNFRVFGPTRDDRLAPAFRKRQQPGVPEDPAITVYTSGFCGHAGQDDSRAGGGNWYGVDDARNSAFRVSGDRRSKGSGEVAAILFAVKSVSHFAPLSIISTSQTIIDALTTGLDKIEESGHIGLADKDLFKATAAALRERGATTKLGPGHNDPGRWGAATLAKSGAGMPDTNALDASIPERFNLEGAQLSALTQARAYTGIREARTKPQRQKTDIRLDMTRHAVRDACGRFPTDPEIWRALRSTDISRNIRNFLWKTTHQLQKIGNYWDSIPTLEIRANCHACGESEDMDHILFDCREVGSEDVWALARELWARKGGVWPNP